MDDQSVDDLTLPCSEMQRDWRNAYREVEAGLSHRIGAINGETFLAYVEQFLVPTL
ncbi:MAG TPA: hypothetical protein VMM15_33765 [Bradyrhizobium sp.]|nr:hypothetical protein [Bradyrhizobium sp.]